MKPTTRLLSLAALIGLSLTSLTNHHAGHAAACATTTTLRVTGWKEPGPETQLLEIGINQFNNLNPCIVARYSPTAQPDYQAEIGREFARKTEPDVFYASPDLIATLGQARRLLKLDPYLASDRVSLDRYIPDLLKVFQVKGSTYGLPKDWGTVAVFYNKDIFDAERVPYPTNNLTYAQFRALAKRLTTTGTMMPADFTNLMPFLYGFGSGILDPVTGRVLFDNPRAIEALTYYTDFQLVDHSATTPTATGAAAIDSLGQGQAAMVIDGSWQLSYLRSAYPNLRFGVAEIPIGPAGRAAPIFTNAWSASVRTAHPAAAVKLIEYLTGAAFQARQLHIGFALPTLTALRADPYLKAHPDVYSFFSEYTAGKPANFGRYDSAINQVLSDAVTAVLLKKSTPAQAITVAAGTLQRRIAGRSR
jgi:multiple sugar transport system substrate-binding protein